MEHGDANEFLAAWFSVVHLRHGIKATSGYFFVEALLRRLYEVVTVGVKKRFVRKYLEVLPKMLHRNVHRNLLSL
jgi:hypothetical protein